MKKHIPAVFFMLLALSIIAGCSAPTPTVIPLTATAIPTEPSVPTFRVAETIGGVFYGPLSPSFAGCSMNEDWYDVKWGPGK